MLRCCSVAFWQLIINNNNDDDDGDDDDDDDDDDDVRLFSSAASAAGWVIDVSVCLCGCLSSNFFQIAGSPTILVWFSRNLAHVICVPISKKTVEQVFEILTLKFMAIFLNFKFGLSLWNSLNWIPARLLIAGSFMQRSYL